MPKRLRLRIEPQPDDSTCGPTCLHAVYRYWGDEIPLARVIAEVPQLATGGTLAVQLGCHALERGYRAVLFTHNLQVFDPTWFGRPRADLRERLIRQRSVKTNAKLRVATDAFLRYLELGGKVEMQDLDRELVLGFLRRGQPVLTGLSATWLYRCARETGDHQTEADDVRGVPQGHFVVLHGHLRRGQRVHVADPQPDNPFAPAGTYVVELDRLISAIHLGVLTYDANLLVLEPARKRT